MRTIVGMFEGRSEAEDAILRLQQAGFGRDAIGVAMKDDGEPSEAIDAAAHDLSGEGATAGAISGAGVGALVGLALAGTSVLLPGIGLVLIGGPLVAGLTGAGLGAASGGLIGGLVGAGIPEDEATDFSQRIESGHILVSVLADDARAELARRILQEQGATGLRTAG